MTTPVCDRAWNLLSPMSPPSKTGTIGKMGILHPGEQVRSIRLGILHNLGTSRKINHIICSLFVKLSISCFLPQPGSPLHAFEARTPGGKYSEAGTPRDSSSAYANAPSPYLPSTPGGQLLTDVTSSPVIGTDSEGPCFMPDIMVNVHRFGEDSVGVIREVLPDGSCRVDLGMNGNGKSEMITALPTEIEKVPPRKNDKIQIVGG